LFIRGFPDQISQKRKRDRGIRLHKDKGMEEQTNRRGMGAGRGTKKGLTPSCIYLLLGNPVPIFWPAFYEM
jgi:hypothetical protein